MLILFFFKFIADYVNMSVEEDETDQTFISNVVSSQLEIFTQQLPLSKQLQIGKYIEILPTQQWESDEYDCLLPDDRFGRIDGEVLRNFKSVREERGDFIYKATFIKLTITINCMHFSRVLEGKYIAIMQLLIFEFVDLFHLA